MSTTLPPPSPQDVATAAGRLTAALRGLTAKVHVEARGLAIAQHLSAWRALAAVLYRNHTRPSPRSRRAGA